MTFSPAALPVTTTGRRIRRIPIVVVDGERRHVPRALLEHLRDLRVRDLEPVLDRITTAVECALQAQSVIGVASHFPAPAMRLVHDGLQFLDGQRRLRNQGALRIDPGARECACTIQRDL